MKTIAERAKELGVISEYRADYPYDKTSVEFGYMRGATEQKAIDIEKACKWLKEQVYQEYGGGPLERLIPDTMIEKFRKAMEE